MNSMGVDVQTCIFLNRGLMGIFARSQEIDAEVLQKIDWQWLETRCSPTELSSGLMMAWSQELSDGSNLIARVIRSAPKGTHASWSIRAIVVDANTYSELIDRMQHCLSDDNFWNRQCFVDGIATQLPNWDRDDAIPANDIVLVKAVIADLKSKGVARIDQTVDCDPWELAVRIPAALQGSSRTRLRWIVGFDNFPRGTHLVAGRYALRVSHSKSSGASSSSISPSTLSRQTSPKAGALRVEAVDSEPEWQVSMVRSSRFRFLSPVSCLLVICVTILFAVYRIRFAS
jgi:hypothetical protein